MSEKGLRQLEYSEIVLHWVNAGPFMILMLTGAFDIFGRLLSVSDQIMDLCVTIHKILGIIWITLILVSFFFVGVKLNIANFKRMFEWNLQDIRFLGMAFRSIVDKKVDVPESWKFNTSQKINSLWVFLYFIVFPITGFMMWLWGTMLIAWYIHAALFFAAVPTVLGHIVVTTFHPSGRVGLKGIFGRAPKFYVLQHDVVSVPGKSATGGGSEALPQFKKVMGGSFINIELLLVIAAIVFGIGGYVFFSGSKGLSKGFDSMISPNELSAAHRIKEINSCTQCHDYTGELRDEKCFKCHKMIKDRVEKKQGYHGTRKEACRDCHSEHPGLLGKIIKIDIKKYDHDTSSFKLVGAHKKVKCEECHKKVPRPNAEDDSAGGYWIGLKFKKCTNCHKDPHYGQFPEEGKYEKCGPCHNNDGWRGKNLVFDHQKDMKHRLEGKHAELKCWTCHPPDEKDANAAIKRFLSDPNRQPDTRKDVRYGTGQFTNMRYKLCTDCHPDPHRGQFKDKECTPCHTIKTWREKDLKFDHNKDTKYKLEGKHADPKCVECHPPGEKDASAAIKRTLSLPKKPEVKKDVRYANAQFRDMRYKLCTDCHEDPHKGQFKDTECTPCHTLKSWREKDLKFDHNKDSKYKLEAKHADAKCVDCHIPGEKDASAAIKKILSLPKKQEAKKDVKYANAQFREMRYKLCTDCHEDIHKGQFKDKLCTPCHTIKSWRAKDIVFDHTKDSKFKLEGKHADLKCWECHPPDEKDANAYILRLSKLHRKPEQMDKERETKKDVKYGTAQFKEIRYKLCKDCHDDVHKKRLGETCEYCHTNKNWKKKQ